MSTSNLAILGCGNIGSAIAKGLTKSGMAANNITLTRRKLESLAKLTETGFQTSIDNANAVQIVSGVSIAEIQEKVGKDIPIIRAMPNTAAVLCESMTCLSSLPQFSQELKTAQTLFEKVGNTLVIDETQMASATALCACGVAFFLRAIRAASQGGIEIGFHSDEAFTIAAQTARGAATLLLDNDSHPEAEIDQVTTPMGATIAGLNEMEHQGFSSAMIKGITTSTEKVTRLYKKD